LNAAIRLITFLEKGIGAAFDGSKPVPSATGGTTHANGCAKSANSNLDNETERGSKDCFQADRKGDLENFS
jgi:hypothetical protein